MIITIVIIMMMMIIIMLNILHARNQHLRDHRGSPVAFPKGLSVAFSDEAHISVVLSKGLSLDQWLFTGTSQRISSGAFQGNATFVISGV